MKVNEIFEEQNGHYTLSKLIKDDEANLDHDGGAFAHPGRIDALKQVLKKHGDLEVLSDYESDPEQFCADLGIEDNDGITTEVKKLKGMPQTPEVFDSKEFEDQDDELRINFWWNGKVGYLDCGDFGDWAVRK